jgi:hypothetical protein
MTTSAEYERRRRAADPEYREWRNAQRLRSRAVKKLLDSEGYAEQQRRLGGRYRERRRERMAVDPAHRDEQRHYFREYQRAHPASLARYLAQQQARLARAI